MIYLDYAATTPVDPQVERAMRPFFGEKFGNPSSLYSLGMEAKSALENSRTKIADILGCAAQEIIFTAGGTEADNLAIFGVVREAYARQLNKKYKPHLIISSVEHHAILHSVMALEKQGAIEATYLNVNEQGIVPIKELQMAIKPGTILVSLIYANNEIGSVMPIHSYTRALRQINSEREKKKLPKILFHTDACQAAGALEIRVNKLGVDLMTINGSKIYGPKQTGVLYKAREIALEPIIYGGGQENNLRSGTENVAGAVGLALALEIAKKNLSKENRRLRILRNYFIKKLLKSIPETILNGAEIENDSDSNPLRLPNNVNVSMKNIEGEALLLYLDAHGICISTGSACTSTSADPSHVIKALGREVEFNQGLRFTLGRSTTKQQLDKVLKILPGIVAELRRIKSIDYT